MRTHAPRRRRLTSRRDAVETPASAASFRGGPRLDRNVVELLLRIDAAQEQPSPAHVAAPDERGRKEQSLAEDLEERVDVLRARDASQEDHLALFADRVRDEARISRERFAERRFVRVDVRARERLEMLETDARMDRHHPAVLRDDERAVAHPGSGGSGSTRERVRVRELAAKIEAAHEAEDLADRTAFARSQLACDGKERHGTKELLAALAVETRRREQEDARLLGHDRDVADGRRGLMLALDRRDPSAKARVGRSAAAARTRSRDAVAAQSAVTT